MPKIALFIFMTMSSVTSANDCIFDEETFRSFVSSYAKAHGNATVFESGELVVVRKEKKVFVTGGGCIHLGSKIRVTGLPLMAEPALLQEVQAIASEFSRWLVSPENLSKAIENRRWQRHEGVYFIQVEGLTTFEAWQKDNGDVLLSFYIN